MPAPILEALEAQHAPMLAELERRHGLRFPGRPR
jgi:hypothetical protein